MINIYADGSARGNGQVNSNGGFGVVILHDNELIYAYSEQCVDTTNNREEIKAILHAFQLAQEKYPEDFCIIYSDSMYCVNICNSWIKTWAQNNWLNSKKKTVENLDLVQKLYSYLTIDFFNAEVAYCGGHRGILENELADALATNNLNRFKTLLQTNNIKYNTSGQDRTIIL